MQTRQEETKFAPAERLDNSAIFRQSRMLEEQGLLTALYEAVMNAVVIVNAQRQIVYCNQNFADFTGFRDPRSLYGMRPGEAIGCIHSEEEAGGCGTAEACAVCGAVNSILDAQQGVLRVREAHIRKQDGTPDANIELKASPFAQDREKFVILSINDISDRVRRRALERVFFHDLMNTASGLKIISEELESAARTDSHLPVQNQLINGITHLIEEIREQRSLMAAETDDLEPTIKQCRSLELLHQLTAYYQYLDIAENRLIRIAPDSSDIPFETDRTLVFRVLSNMLKNALEASGPGETVVLACRAVRGGVEFSVQNPAYMPKNIQFQVFHRAFSTKSSGRGLGTYSMKLLTEHYLGGRVSFTSSHRNGTCFRAWYPLKLDSVA
jgi:signal transduction histidine kinase